MITASIKAALKYRSLVLLGAVIIALLGWRAVQQTPVDAIPDLSDVQVIIKTEFPGQAPNIVEQQVTWPLSNIMLAVPGAETVRGYSFYGDSYVYVIFADDTDLYWARSRVLEYLNQAQGRLPAGVTPELGPDASGVGWIYQYVLRDDSNQYHLGELTALQDWFLKQQLQSIKGVAEVATVGGMVNTFQVVVEPKRLQQYGLTLAEVEQAITDHNNEVGGGIIEMAEAEYMVRGTGYIQSLDDLRQIPLPQRNERGATLTLADVAQVRRGPESRRGIADLNGEGEVVGGIVVMRDGGNAREVISAVEQKLAELEPGLPAGVTIETTYNRADLISRTIANLTTKLWQELAFVAIVVIVFLLHLRASLVALISIPLAVLASFILMRQLGISANMMSLGGIAIAIGTLVDAAIVMVENTHKHLHQYQVEHGQPARAAQHWQIVQRASIEVGPALFLSLLIITVSFLPVFTLEAQEGRLFEPLAYTKTFAMAAAALIAVTVIPVLLGYLVRGRMRSERQNPLNRIALAAYRPLLRFTLVWPKTVIAVIALLTASAIYPWQQLEQEFLPRIDEGDLLYMPTTLPGLSPAQAGKLLQQTDALIAAQPEVERVFGKAGRAQTATDPAPLTMFETTIQLKPKSQWREGITLDDVIAELDQRVQVPGLTNAWVQPIKTRIDMLATGLRTPLGIRVTGPNLTSIQALATEIEGTLRGLPGLRSVFAERPLQGRYIEIVPNLAKAARYGVEQAQLQQIIRYAIGGAKVSEAVIGTERYPINLRYPRQYRDHISRLQSLPVVNRAGTWVTLADVADIRISSGPAQIRSENAQLSSWLYLDLADGVTAAAVIEAAQQRLAQLDIPAQHALEWQGQYEQMERVKNKLQSVIPLTLAVILALLYLVFQSYRQALWVIATLPVALAGGLWLLWWLEFNLSVATAVGFIALAGVAVEFGVVMLLYLNNAWQAQSEPSLASLEAAIEEGALQRLRPKLMTVLTIVFGLLPIMLTSGTGSEVMQRIAAPMLGGMILAPLLSLLVLPAIFKLFWQRRLKDS
ncbi:efflux RND transporter permease subunit [Pseudidiomarina taiwanensis]|uniref:CusA/CzcA family heavy metal efflux RND transporter n=1 Tax=Pseudidiomarina taiwanensis TaxID=337250 RepID=A0A432ZKF7_9GAMM|nr:CusA/CzcA family heavy metal efflux RND transporter [Pseudidiomarina taiwanensis]RUO78505.1 CusA/CzcA family heavy metal efflux RND transporter [Pseudidiomarina taiwanensis]